MLLKACQKKMGTMWRKLQQEACNRKSFDWFTSIFSKEENEEEDNAFSMQADLAVHVTVYTFEEEDVME